LLAPGFRRAPVLRFHTLVGAGFRFSTFHAEEVLSLQIPPRVEFARPESTYGWRLTYDDRW
jgi:hypothetical protein